MNMHTTITPEVSEGKSLTPVPADFFERARDATNNALKAHYGVGDKLILRWRSEANCPTPKIVREVMAVPSDFKDRATRLTNRKLADHYQVGEKTITRWRKETGLTGSLVPFRMSSALPKQHIPGIPAGRVAEAAQFLRKTHAPVYHRIIEGKEFNGQYCVGTRLMTGPELVEYAETKGFEPISDIYHSRFD